MVKVSVESLKVQATSAKTNTEKLHNMINEYQTNITSFITDDSLKGEAYNKAKEFGASTILVILSALENYYEEVAEKLEKVHQCYIECVDTKSWSSEELEEIINKFQTFIDLREEQLLKKQHQSKKSDYTRLVITEMEHELSLLDNAKREYEKILQNLLSFSEEVGQFFSDLGNIQSKLEIGFNQITSSINSGNFSVLKDTEWLEDLKEFSAKQEMERYNLRNKDEWLYFKTLQDIYGFDEETSRIIIKLKHGIDRRFRKFKNWKDQNYKDYIFARVIGAITYRGWDKEANFQWFAAAGSLSFIIGLFNDLEEGLEDFGLNKNERKKLIKDVNIQHKLSFGSTLDFDKVKKQSLFGKLKEEYISEVGKNNFSIEKMEQDYLKYRESPDFTHQMITTSTILDKNHRLAEKLADFDQNADNKHFDMKVLDELAGWRGDSTNGAFAGISMSRSDYMSDLDSVNITSMMKKDNISYQRVSNKYYKKLSNGKINRAKEFMKNSGHTMSEMEDIILEHGDDNGKNSNSDSRNFIYSLKQKSNTMIIKY